MPPSSKRRARRVQDGLGHKLHRATRRRKPRVWLPQLSFPRVGSGMQFLFKKRAMMMMLKNGIVLISKCLAKEWIVDNMVPMFGVLTFPGGRPAARRCRLRSLFLLLLPALVSVSAVARADVQNPPVTSVGRGQQVAIADFDGDLSPDFASIQAWPNSSGTTNYRIQLQLSAVGQQSIQLVAPSGGLLIEARDVNGDQAVDLVLATAWFNQPVAVLLNNGHGDFSRAAPAVFPGAFSESTTKWTSNSGQATDAIGVPPQSNAGIWPGASDLPHGRSRSGSIPPSSLWFHVSSFLISYAGRAPPSEVPHP